MHKIGTTIIHTLLGYKYVNKCVKPTAQCLAQSKCSINAGEPRVSKALSCFSKEQVGKTDK